ncbi:MAG: Gfo/Idh/MocA family oxidoreductase [Verrucomicrobia bacterium]|nr:MAG: Gfo/Idh/MocA family oxidoreductase [Verrucomicrobiota bacterium]
MTSPKPFRIDRRRFLRTSLAGAATGPLIFRGLLANPPSSQVAHASFGAGGMAWADLTEIAGHKNVRVVAVADVDANRTAEFRKKFPNAKVYADYRQLLDKERPDSVNVSTPDHMHAPIGMAALQRGIHVYGQKPLTHDLHETRRLTEFARKKKLVTQMGIQIHSAREYRLAVRLVHDGAIGKIREAHTWSSKDWGDNGEMPRRHDPIPQGLDWNLWLGVCADRPFIGQGWYHPGNWRRRLDFGTGTFGDMGCHIFDPVFGALALTSPISVRSEGAAPNSHSWATNAVIRYVFPATRYTTPGTIPVVWYDGNQRPPAEVRALIGKTPMPDQGSILIGTEGVMVIPHVAPPVLLPDEKYAGMKLPDVGHANHWHEFIDAVRGEGHTSAGFGYSGPLTESVLLGSVATRFPRTTLEWNAAKLAFTNVREANAHVKRSYRAGWHVPGLS